VTGTVHELDVPVVFYTGHSGLFKDIAQDHYSKQKSSILYMPAVLPSSIFSEAHYHNTTNEMRQAITSM
jgi:hypothetical protein